MKPFKDTAIQILRWSERYTKTDMVYLTKGGGVLGLGQLIASLVGFLTAILFANFVPKETYGVYKFVLSATALLSIPTLTGMGTAVTRAVARGFQGTLGQALRSKMIWGILGSIGGLVLAGYYYSQENVLLATAFFVVALFLPVMEAFGVYDSFLQGKKEFGLSVKYATLSKVVSIVALATTIFFTNNLIFLLFAYFIPFTFFRFVFFKHIEKKLKTNDTPDTDTVVYGKHLSIMGILGVVAGHLDKMLVFNFLGASELAVYAIISAPVEQIKGLVDNVSKIALPKFSRQTSLDIRSTIWRRFLFLVGALSIIAIAYWFFAPIIFPIFFRQYTEFVNLTQIFGLSIISFALFIPLQILQSQQATRSLYILNITTSALQIGLSVLFLALFGLVGVVLARVIARFLNLGIYLITLTLSLRNQSS